LPLPAFPHSDRNGNDVTVVEQDVFVEGASAPETENTDFDESFHEYLSFMCDRESGFVKE
jgi:hypothetical protein